MPDSGRRVALIGGSGSPRLLRSLIPGTSIRFVRVRSYDRPDRSIVTVLLVRASAKRTTIWAGAVQPNWTTRAFVLVLGGE
jgi:hypothetical protein